jgi:hypothetical protein
MLPPRNETSQTLFEFLIAEMFAESVKRRRRFRGNVRLHRRLKSAVAPQKFAF